MVEFALVKPGFRAVCLREVQKTLQDSAKYLIEAKLKKFGLSEKDGFKVTRDDITTPGGGKIIFQGIKDHTSESIKSLEAMDVAWVEEAQTITKHSLDMLLPTIRMKGSERWFSWNPRSKNDPVDIMFRTGAPPTDSIVIKHNWSDNPFLPDESKQDIDDCLKNTPELYNHIWLGDYATYVSGAYYTDCLLEAERQDRVTELYIDKLMPIYAFFDIGIRDATSIWVAQFVNDTVKVLDYYEAIGQSLDAHLNWLRTNGYDNAVCYLPHDGANKNVITARSYEDHIREAGFRALSIANQGRGAALKRIEEVRRLFPKIHIDKKRCEAGIMALGAYHEKIDENRNCGLGPEHDWSSHAADAFGLMCIAHRQKADYRIPTQITRQVI